MPANASAEFQRAVAQLEATVRGEGLEPPAPRCIPMREYYEESERQQTELIALQREQLERLERAGLVGKQQQQPRQQSPLTPGAIGRRTSRSRSVQRSMSFAGIFLIKGGGGKRGTDGGPPGSPSPLRRKSSTQVFDDPLSARAAAMPSLLVRKQSSVGLGMLLSSSPLCQNEPAADVSYGDSDSRGSFTSPASLPQGNGANAPTSALGGAPIGGIVLTKALQDLLRRDASGRPILLKPLYNPYRTSEREEEVNVRKKLRPHTLKLLQPLSFSEASEVRDMQKELRNGIAMIQSTASFSTTAMSSSQESSSGSRRHNSPPLSSLQERMREWRSKEDEQLRVFRRNAVAAVAQERRQWDHINKRERGILAKVEHVQQQAAAIQAVRDHERHRLEDMKFDSHHRVAVDCLINAELAFRNRLTAVEAAVRSEWQSVGMVSGASTA
jgi:hypothetical protein